MEVRIRCKRVAAVAANLEGDWTVEAPSGEGSARLVRVRSEEAMEMDKRLGVVASKRRKEESVVAEGKGAAARAVEVGEDAKDPQST